MRRYLTASIASTLAIALVSCTTVKGGSAAEQEQSIAPPDNATEQEQAQSLGDFFESYDAAKLEYSPTTKSFRGIRDEDYARWGDLSEASDIAVYELLQSYAVRMREEYDLADLSPEDALSYRLFDAMAQRGESLFPFRSNGYIFDQRSGPHNNLPAFLINVHSVKDETQAAAYVSRIHGLGPSLDVLTAQSRERADAGVMPPKWVYPYMISDIENLLNAGISNAVLEDFDSKVDGLNRPAAISDSLKAAAEEAWVGSAAPAYQRLLSELKRQEAMASPDDGVWRLPNGGAYYEALLGHYTTTNLSADEIHNIGLREVERIHGEMSGIMMQVGFEGSLQEFFEYTRTNPQFFYTNREEYLADAQARLDAMETRLPEFFATLPTDPLTIKPVEAFREQSAGKAFYQRPAPDGSRPGTYYVNLFNLNDMSKNELEALAFHEGLPGHHLQLSIQTGLGDVPPFRRFGGVTAYSEGWGLYSEELGKDMGFYQDPYSDFGRLGMELWRACRLVVDTGIHDKRWSREEAIAYLTENTPNPDGDIRKAIERYIVYPGQATAYMIGKLKIMELRDMARTELGDDFDIRGFHDAVLTSGPVPLNIMQENVEAWVASEKGISDAPMIMEE